MYAEGIFKTPILQRLNEMLNHLTMKFEWYCTQTADQRLVTSEETARKVATEFKKEDVSELGTALGVDHE